MSSTLLRRAATSSLVVLCLLLTLALPATPAAAMTGTITGKLADSVTKAPIQGAEVYLGIPGAYIWAHTAADGSFTIAGVPPGTYAVETWHERLGTIALDVTLGADQTTALAFQFTSR